MPEGSKSKLIFRWDALRDAVPFVFFKIVKSIHGGVLFLVKLQAKALLKVTLLYGWFHVFKLYK